MSGQALQDTERTESSTDRSGDEIDLRTTLLEPIQRLCPLDSTYDTMFDMSKDFLLNVITSNKAALNGNQCLTVNGFIINMSRAHI